MNKGLLVVERMVLECLGRRPLDAQDIALGTGLRPTLVSNVLRSLVNKGLASLMDGGVVLVEEGLEGRLPTGKSLEQEVRELFVSYVNYFFEQQDKGSGKAQLRMRKVRVSETDQRTLEAHLQNLDTFMRYLEANSKDVPMSEKRLFFWGQCPYADVVKQSLSGA